MKRVLSLIMFVVLAFSLVACGAETESQGTTTASDLSEDTSSSNDSTGGTIDKIKSKGELILATSPDYPPYEFKILEDGKEKVVGFDIAIAEEIAKDMGVNLRILELDFNGLLVALNANKADIVMAGMTPSEERKQAIDFSEIYYVAEQAIIISPENKDTITSLESLSGKKVGVQKGSIQEAIAAEQLPDAKVMSLIKLPNIILDVLSGNLDAAIIELPVAQGYVKQYQDRLALADFTVSDPDSGSAVAVKKGNEDLVEQVNSTIQRLQEEGLISQFVIEANEIVDSMIE